MGWIKTYSQQRKLMGSSAQNSSGVHWCRSRVRFNGVPEKVPDKVWEALVQSQVRLTGFQRRFRRRFGRVWCRARSGSTGFRREGFRSGEGSGEGLGDFGAEPGQFQQGSGEGGLVQRHVRVQQGFGVVQSHVRLGSGEGSGRVLVWPGSTRLQVGSGATPGVWSSKFRTKQL